MSDKEDAAADSRYEMEQSEKLLEFVPLVERLAQIHKNGHPRVGSTKGTAQDAIRLIRSLCDDLAKVSSELQAMVRAHSEEHARAERYKSAYVELQARTTPTGNA